jgi:hypothetical protein
MPRAGIIGALLLVLLIAAAPAMAEITVSITATSPADGAIGEGDSAVIAWTITTDGENGDWQFEIGGDGTWGSGSTASSSDASGTFSGSTQGSSTIKSTDLTDGDGDYTVYLIAVDSSDSEVYDFTSTTISLDNPPDMVNGVSAGNGNGKIFVSWEALDVDDINYYQVYYARSSGSVEADYDGADASEGVSPIDAGDGTSVTLNGLSNEVTYYVRVSAVDDSGIEGALSLEASATPLKSSGLTDQNGEEGGCFIATAAYGNYDAPAVRIFRNFRDQVMAKSPTGRNLIQFYYRHSPPVANWMSGRTAVKAAVRTALVPVAWYAQASLRYPAASAGIPLALVSMLLCTAFSLVLFVRRKAQ